MRQESHMDIKVETSVRVTIAGEVKTLTRDEAEALYSALFQALGKYVQIQPVQPYRPTYIGEDLQAGDYPQPPIIT